MVLEDIKRDIAAHRPERGGALYGIKNIPLITHFEYDDAGKTSYASYVPSTQLIANVQRVERETGLQFKGIVHSHPRGLNHPSGGDEKTVQSFFRLNPHYSVIALPIVQEIHPRQDPDSSECVHWYRVERRGTSSLTSSSWSLSRSCLLYTSPSPRDS